MSAGTLTLTNNSDAVAGSGTAFTTEVAAGDFIVVTVGGVPYTLPIKSVESGTALTLVSNFTGPTQAGAAWSAVPRMALNMVTAALVAQSAEALRGLNYDKQNWQQVFSGAGNVTVRLPDGATFTGPSWKYLSDSQLKKSQNLSDITDVNAARINLQVQGAACNQGTSPGDYNAYRSPTSTYELRIANNGEWRVAKLDDSTTSPLAVYAGGTASTDAAGARRNLAAAHVQNSFASADSSQFLSGPALARNPGAWTLNNSTAYPTNFGTLLVFSSASNTDLNTGMDRWYTQLIMGHDRKLRYGQNINGNASPWDLFYTSYTTTTDTNGNLRPASPIVKLNGDGTAELNDESAGVVTERIGTGVYKISGILGFNSDPIWGGVDGGLVIPTNGNGLPLLWVDYEIEPDGDITIRTFHRTHRNAPEFARNVIGVKNEDGSFTETVRDGELVDIPAGRWVDLRVEMPQNSLWNIKLQETQKTMEKAEHERQQNQLQDQL